MVKLFIMFTLLLGSQVGLAQIATPSEELLEQDLNFSHSDEDEQKSEERGLASDQELNQDLKSKNKGKKVEYWSY